MRFWRSRRPAESSGAVHDSRKNGALGSAATIGRLDYEKLDVFMHADSPVEKNLRLRACAKEPGTVRWIEESLRPGDVLYDVGANTGAYSLLAYRLTDGRARIYSFEPSFSNYGQLVRNIVLNNASASVVPLPFPLFSQTRMDSMHYANLGGGESLHSFGRAIDYKDEAFTPIVSLGTLGLSLDSLLEIAGVEPPTLMKIDVDGNERDILQGATRTLRRTQLRSLIIEINEGVADLAADILARCANANLMAREKHHLADGLFNYVFLRSAGEVMHAPRDPAEVPVTHRRGPR